MPCLTPPPNNALLVNLAIHRVRIGSQFLYYPIYTIKTLKLNTLTTTWSFQLHTCCVHDMLQTSRDAFNLNQGLSVVEKLLPQ